MMYLGIDVSKAKLDCCLLLNTEAGKRKTKCVANNDHGFSDLLHWIDKQGVARTEVRVLMEGTGVYHTPAAIALTQAQLGCEHPQSGTRTFLCPVHGDAEQE